MTKSEYENIRNTVVNFAIKHIMEGHDSPKNSRNYNDSVCDFFDHIEEMESMGYDEALKVLFESILGYGYWYEEGWGTVSGEEIKEALEKLKEKFPWIVA